MKEIRATPLPTKPVFSPKDKSAASPIGTHLDGCRIGFDAGGSDRKVSDEDFDRKVKNMYLDVAKEIGENIPVEVANDGDVTALAGAMDLNDDSVLGIAMGTSEAGGYVDPRGNITGWLNELAFVPVNFCEEAMVDEWSGDYGCGVKYFSQDGVIKVAPWAEVLSSMKTFHPLKNSRWFRVLWKRATKEPLTFMTPSVLISAMPSLITVNFTT